MLYVDANNLYGKAMCEYLPYSGIKSNNDISIDDDLNTPYESYIGYMVYVDLSFPKPIHEVLNQFVACPETITPTKEWFSDYQPEVQAYLVAHLYDRKQYTIQYRNSKCLVSLTVKSNNVMFNSNSNLLLLLLLGTSGGH